MSDSLVLFSGGPDSTAAVLWALDNGLDPELLTFEFFDGWQSGELRSAMNVAESLGLSHTIVDLKGIYHSVGGAPPPMHGSDRIADESPYLQTRLPFAMSIIFSLTASISLFRGIHKVLWGATRDDGAQRIDYGEEFASRFAKMLNSSEVERNDVEILLPLAELHKWQGLRSFRDRPELFALTWSCITERQRQCGKCRACVARRTAATAASLKDATKYLYENYESPVTEEQLRNPDAVPPEVWQGVFQSPKGPE